jgi:hypothetical protein
MLRLLLEAVAVVEDEDDKEKYPHAESDSRQ